MKEPSPEAKPSRASVGLQLKPKGPTKLKEVRLTSQFEEKDVRRLSMQYSSELAPSSKRWKTEAESPHSLAAKLELLAKHATKKSVTVSKSPQEKLQRTFSRVKSSEETRRPGSSTSMSRKISDPSGGPRRPVVEPQSERFISGSKPLRSAQKIAPIFSASLRRVELEGPAAKPKPARPRPGSGLKESVLIKAKIPEAVRIEVQARHLSVEAQRRESLISPKRNNSSVRVFRGVSSTLLPVSEGESSEGAQIDHLEIIRRMESSFPLLEKSKVSLKRYGKIEAFAVNTSQGIKRSYNEDRVSILLNAEQKLRRKSGSASYLKNCSLFSIFDGHGGSDCCNFLKDRLHQAMLEEIDYDKGLIDSLKRIFQSIEADFLKLVRGMGKKHSGSCSLTMLTLNKILVLVNLGDSRAVASYGLGKEVRDLTFDHKPEKIGEFSRVVAKGGELYRVSTNVRSKLSEFCLVNSYDRLQRLIDAQESTPDVVFGPWRIKPGGLSVSRSFGDIESKSPEFGGIQGCVSAEPDIFDHEIGDMDFVILGCDGIFDKLSSKEVVEVAWQTIRSFQNSCDLSDQSNYTSMLDQCVNNILKRAMAQRSEDNVTVIMVCFKDFSR